MSTSTIVLLIYIFFLVPAMLVGFGFARRKLFRPHHKLVMTSITIINWILILIVMQASYRSVVAPTLPDGLSEAMYLIPTLHLVTGGIAQLLATYLVIMMWFEKSLPKWFVIHKIKTPMRLTLSLWILTAVLGLGIYIVWNAPVGAGDNLSPVSTEEAPISTEEAITNPDATPDGTLEPVATSESTPDGTLEPVTTPEGTPASVENTPSEPVSTPESTAEATQISSSQSVEPVSTPETTAEATSEAIEPVSTPETTTEATSEAIEPVSTPETTTEATSEAIEPVSTPDVESERIEAIRVLLNNPQTRREWVVERWRSVSGRVSTSLNSNNLEPVATLEIQPVSTSDIQPVSTEDNHDSNDDNGGDNSGSGNNNDDNSGGNDDDKKDDKKDD